MFAQVINAVYKKNAIHIVYALLAFLFAKAIVFILFSQYHSIQNFFQSSSYSRWDSGLYLQMAKIGRELFPCKDNPEYWCGNAGWMPMYPFLCRIISEITSFSLDNSALFITNVFFLLLLFQFSKWFSFKSFSVSNFLLLFSVAIAPGSIYFHAIFPISMVTFFLIFGIRKLQLELYTLAGFSFGAAIWCYGIGFFVLPTLFCFWIATVYFDKRISLKKANVFIIPLAFFCGILIMDYFWLGKANALFLIQEKYGHGFNNPIKHIIMHCQRAIQFLKAKDQFAWVYIQNILVSILILFISIQKCIFLVKQKNTFSLFQLMFIFINWFLSVSASPDVALYRNASVSAPFASAFQKNKVLIVAIFIVFLFLFWKVSPMFFNDRLI